MLKYGVVVSLFWSSCHSLEWLSGSLLHNFLYEYIEAGVSEWRESDEVRAEASGAEGSRQERGEGSYSTLVL